MIWVILFTLKMSKIMYWQHSVSYKVLLSTHLFNVSNISKDVKHKSEVLYILRKAKTIHTLAMDLLYLSMYPGKRLSLPFFAASESISKYFPVSDPPASGE